MIDLRKQNLGGVLVLLLVTCANAEEKDDDDDDNEGPDYKNAVGAMVSAERSLYVGGDDNIQVEPGAVAEWGRVYIYDTELGVKLYEGDRWSVSTSIAVDFTKDTERGDSPLLVDMEELDDVVLGQIEVAFEDQWGELSLTLASDISDTHGGDIAELSYVYPLEFGRWLVEPEVSIAWNSSKVFQYYYGVDPVDVLPTRPLYGPDGGTIAEFGVAAMYPFGKRHALRFQIEMELFPNQVTDSPIVVRDNVVEVGIGYFFLF